MGRKYTKDEIMSMLNEMNYSLVSEQYTDIKSKVDIVDSDGYYYNVSLSNMINSGRRPERFRKTNIHTTKNIQHYLDTCSGGTVILSTEYKNAHELLSFSCSECGEAYSASLNHVISRRQFMCNKCSSIRKGMNHRVPQEKLEKEYEMSGLTLIDTGPGLYTDSRKCIDKNGKTYYISYVSLRNRNAHGYSTYTRSMSRNESIICSYLTENNIKFTQEYTFEDCKDKQKLRFDFAVFNGDDIAFLIEVDGEQHFFPISFNGEPEEESTKNYYCTIKRDRIKDNYCNKKGIELLRIPYYQINNGEYKQLLQNKIRRLQDIAV